MVEDSKKPERGEGLTAHEPPASSSYAYEIKVASVAVGTTTSGPSVVITSAMPTVAPPADDPIATVAYESWMFIETTDLALNHWDDFPNIVVQHAIVEDAVLHARSLCEVIVSSSDPDSITLKKLFPDLDTNINKFKVLRELKKQLAIEYDQDKSPSYRELFNSRVMHPSILRGDYGQYGEPLRRLRPKIFAVVREIAALTGYPFSLPPMS